MFNPFFAAGKANSRKRRQRTDPDFGATSARRKLQLIDAAVPELRARVNDQAQLLSVPEASRLETKLLSHERATGQQLALLTLPDLKGVNIENYGFTVFNTWKLGRKEYKDGLRILISLNERKVDIEVGYGLEAAISDELAASVIQEQITPAFRKRDYAGGLDAAFDRLIAAATPPNQ